MYELHKQHCLAEAKRSRAAYYGLVEITDRYVGEIVKAADQNLDLCWDEEKVKYEVDFKAKMRKILHSMQ